MAAPMKRHEDRINSDKTTSRFSTSCNNNGQTTKESPLSSKQLLYSEKFPDQADDKLKIIQNSGRGKLKTDFSDHKTYRVPQSSVLTQVKGFLPQLESSNADLERRLMIGETSDLDIENVGSCTGPVIEMNLALVEMNSDDSDGTASSSEDSNSDSDCEDIRENNIQIGKVTESNIKLTKIKDKKTQGSIIEVLKSEREVVDPRETTLDSDHRLINDEMCNGMIT